MRFNATLPPLTVPSRLVQDGPARAPQGEAAARRRVGTRLGFSLFLLVHAVVFVRPGDLWAATEAVPIYQVLLLACLAASLGPVLSQLTWASLSRRPVTLLVVCLLPAVFLSNLSSTIYDARMGAFEFLKVLFYYLLLVALVDSASRLRTVLGLTVVLLAFVAVLSLLHYHGVIELESMEPVNQWTGVDEETGEREGLARLQGTGIFGDPNDFGVTLVAGLLMAAHCVIEKGRKAWWKRGAWLAVMVPMVWAMALTSSRGAFLAMMAGAMTLAVLRIGWKRSLPLAALGLPVLLVAFGGRQTSIDLGNKEDTFQGRVMLWRDGLVLLRENPLFGCGFAMMGEKNGQVAHNSYVHAYAELGLFGGTLFVGAMYLTVMGIYRLRKAGDAAAEPGLRGWSGALLAVVVAYALGITSLSRAYAIPTYLLIGAVAVYGQLAAAGRGPVRPSLDGATVRQVLAASFGFLVFIHVFVRVV